MKEHIWTCDRKGCTREARTHDDDEAPPLDWYEVTGPPEVGAYPAVGRREAVYCSSTCAIKALSNE